MNFPAYTEEKKIPILLKLLNVTKKMKFEIALLQRVSNYYFLISGGINNSLERRRVF